MSKSHCLHPEVEPQHFNVRMVCCWCGFVREDLAKPITGHGPHLKPNAREYDFAPPADLPPCPGHA